MTLHPHAIAWPNRLQVLDDFLVHLRSLPAIWNPTGAELAAHWLQAYPASTCLRLEETIWQDYADSLS